MSKAGEGKFEQQEDKSAQKDALNGLGGDLLSKKDPVKASEKNADGGIKPGVDSNTDGKTLSKNADATDTGAPKNAAEYMDEVNKKIGPKVESLKQAGALDKDVVKDWQKQFPHIPQAVWDSMGDTKN